MVRCRDVDTVKLRAYLSQILDWNDRAGLVSKRQPLDVIARMTLRSLELWEFVCAHAPGGVAADARVVDIGTGAGFPGVVWKLASPGLRVTLAERRQKKAAFLERLPTILSLDGLDIHAGNAEQLAQLDGHAGVYDVAVTLAVGTVVDATPIVKPLLCPGGVFATVRPQDDIATEPVGDNLSSLATAPCTGGVCQLYVRT